MHRKVRGGEGKAKGRTSLGGEGRAEAEGREGGGAGGAGGRKPLSAPCAFCGEPTDWLLVRTAPTLDQTDSLSKD